MPVLKSSLPVITLCLCLFAGPVQLHAAQEGAPPQLETLFLGPKAESADLLRELLQGVVGEQSAWRQGFHPTDRSLITPQTLATPEAAATRSTLKQQLAALSSRLQANSNPWFSPRYLGHMNSDLLLPAVAGYVSAMLYNANNVVYEGGPATTEIELEVAEQLAGLLGYDPALFWGNLTAGGSTANFQALWFARNLKSFPLAVKAVMPELVKGLSQQQLQNLPVDRILQLVDQVKTDRRYEAVLARTVKGKGVASAQLGKVLVPQSRHYSWDKAADLLGLGNEAIITVPVDRQYRMDVAALDRIIADLAKRKVPVLAVVSVLGTTEEGAIDETDRIAALQKKYAARGIGFFYHIDAAYGGYLRSMFINPAGGFMTLDAARQLAQCENLIAQKVQLLVVAPHDAAAASVIVDKAHRAGIKVISYDRLIRNAPVDLYISYDNEKVGELQGQYLTRKVPRGNYVVLSGAPTDNNAAQFKNGAMRQIKPLADKGEIAIVMEQAVKDWLPSEAMKLVENALTAHKNRIDAILAPNDGTAGGAIAALAAQKLDGKVPVTGQDAEASAARRILEGTQSMTIFKDARRLAAETIIAAKNWPTGLTPAPRHRCITAAIRCRPGF